MNKLQNFPKDEPVYFKKVEFRYSVANGFNSTLLLNLSEKKLSYQIYKIKKTNIPPSIFGTRMITYGNESSFYEYSYPAQFISNGKNSFIPKLLPMDNYEYEVTDSFSFNLSEDNISDLLPLCNALEYEPYREKQLSMNDEGYIGYRDESNLDFTGVSYSYLPSIRIDMTLLYDEIHILPCEKLYQYLCDNYLNSSKELRRFREYLSADSLCLKWFNN